MSGQLAEGTVFAGRYRVLHLLAAGGMGAVYKVLHLETNRKRALKVMHPHLFDSEDMQERFRRETNIAAEVESDHIVEVFDAGVDEATRMPFLVMELLRGEDLGQRRKNIGRFPAVEVVTYLEQAALAIDLMHGASIVHRDLKPPNLFLTQASNGSPRIKVLDFGVAKLVADGVTSAGLTQSLGTPIYMAPEQFLSNVRLTGAADIFALTMIAYTLLVNQSYWAKESKGADNQLALAVIIMQGVTESAVKRAAEEGVSLPPAFDPWFAKGTAKDPADRYPNAMAAVVALGAALGVPTGPGAVMPTPPGGWRPKLPSYSDTPDIPERTPTVQNVVLTPTPGARSWVLPAVVGAMVVLGVMLGAAVWVTLQRPRSSQTATAPIVSAAAPLASSAPPVASTVAPIVAAPLVVPAPAEPSATAKPSAPTGVKPVSNPTLPVTKSTARPAPTLSQD